MFNGWAAWRHKARHGLIGWSLTCKLQSLMPDYYYKRVNYKNKNSDLLNSAPFVKPTSEYYPTLRASEVKHLLKQPF